MLKFNIAGDKLVLKIEEDRDKLNSGSKGYYTAEFNFDSDWNELIPHITITENGTPRADEVIINNTYNIATTESGIMQIGVYGLDSNGKKCISSNKVCVEVSPGAYTGVAPIPKDIWDGYQITVLGYVERAEGAADKAESAAEKAKASAEAAEESAKSAEAYKENAKIYAEESLSAKKESLVAKEATEKVLANVTELAQATENAKNESILAKDAANAAKEGLETAEANAKKHATDAESAATAAKSSADKAAISETNSKASEEATAKCKADTEQLTSRAEIAAESAEESEQNAFASEKTASQALLDLLTMINSGDIVLAINGKLPLSAIPATATQEIYTVTNENELTSLIAQRGDLAELVEEVNGERTITKTWQCLGDASVRENWVVWGTSYAVQSGNATTADNATNANMINNHRVVEMTEDEFASAVKDADTYYLVY